MGLLDELTGSLMNTLGGAADAKNLLMKTALGLVSDRGLGEITGKLKDAGLGAQVQSWTGTGKNLPVEPGEIAKALGPRFMGRLAEKSGLDASEAADALAKILPSVIDKLTPDGSINEDSVKSRVAGIDLGDVADLVGSFFKKS